MLTLTVSPREDCGEVVFEPDLPGGAEDGCERQETYLPDASVTFTALSAEGYHFVQWLCPGNPSDPIHGSPNTQQTTLMANDKAYVAEFAADTPVQLVVSASGNGTVSPASGGYAQNQQITLKATPAEDSQFLYWEQVNPPGLEIAEACITITMDQDRELRAVFIAREYHSLTINTVSMSPGATGWVARVPAGTGMPPQYVTNTYVHLAAQPEGTTALRHWDGPVQMSVEDDPVQKLQDPHQIVLMDADKTITAYFDITYGLVLHAVHAELGAVHCPTQPVRGLFRYWPGTEVQIEAHPRENARFDHWEIEGQHAGSDNPHTHVITGDVSVEGFFMEQFDLSLEQPGNGAYIYVADAVPPPVEGRFDAGTQITLAYQNPPAGTWRMDHWEIDGEDVGAENTITFTITDDSRATVHLVQTFALWREVQPPDEGSLQVSSMPPANADGRYDFQSAVEITPIPAAQAYFLHWAVNGEDIFDQEVLYLTMEEDTSVVAHFEVTHTLSLTVPEGGEVTIDPPGGVYTQGQLVVLTATPSPGWEFVEWSGDLTSAENPASLSMDADKTVTALFVPRVSFTAIDSSIDENAGADQLGVALSAASINPVTVTYTTSDETATAGEDYTAESGVVSFVPGQVSRTIEISITDDSLDDDDETFLVTLSASTGAVLAAPIVHRVTIIDNDDPPPIPEVRFATATSSFGEDSGTVFVTVELSESTSEAVSIGYAVTGGTAVGGGSDYTLADGVLEFTSSITSRDIELVLHDDEVYEGDKTILIELSNPSPPGKLTLGSPAQHIVEIADNESTTDIAPDLVPEITQPSDGTRVKPGQAVEVMITITNSSAFHDTGGVIWHDAVFVSCDAVLDDGDKELVRAACGVSGSLPPGGFYIQTLLIEPMPDIAPGPYYLIVKPDADNLLVENGETDTDTIAIVVVDPVLTNE